jgi:hypothetical protein
VIIALGGHAVGIIGGSAIASLSVGDRTDRAGSAPVVCDGYRYYLPPVVHMNIETIIVLGLVMLFAFILYLVLCYPKP